MSEISGAVARIVYPVFLSALLITAAAESPATARPVDEFAPPSNVSVAEVARGDTLEGMLRELGFDGQVLVEIILGFSTELDPEQLQPGQRIEVFWSDREAREAERLVLTMGEERIQLDTAGLFPFATAEPDPELDWTEDAVRFTIDETLIESLEAAGAPAGVGLELAAALGGLVDFSREVQGGEPVEVLFRQGFLPDGEPAGRVEIRYAKVEIGGRTLELARDGGAGAPVQVFKDGSPIRLSAMPVTGAYISSQFGSRKHPVLGTVRMHSGVDYAALTGTPVFASAPGRVTRVGTNGGYGRMVEIEHDAELTTRYAHLSAYAEGLEVGQRVEAGQTIGAVGESGLATGPHLHYEVRYAGRPVDPLSDEHVAALAGPVSEERSEAVLQELRNTVTLVLQPLARIHPEA